MISLWLTPLLLSLVYPLFFIAHNLTGATPEDGIGVLLSGVVLASLCYAAGFAFTRKPAPALRIASLLALCNLSFVLLHGGHALWVAAGLLAAAVLWLWKIAPSTLERRFLWIFSLALAGVNACLIVWGLAMPARQQAQPMVQEAIATAGKRQTFLPNVLYVIPDRFPSERTLQQHYGFSNRPFYASLRSAGFKVHEDSHANYTTTFPSLVSVLNMHYLPHVVAASRYVSNENYLLAPFNRNAVFDIFNALGYDTTFMGGAWNTLHHMESAKHNVSLYIGSEEAWPSRYVRMFLDETLLRLPIRAVFHSLDTPWLEGMVKKSKAMACRNNAYQEKELLSILENPMQPQFIFWHLYLPHPPYMYDSRHDSCMDIPQAMTESREKGHFIEQLLYTNKLLLRVARKAQQSSKRPLIIVLQSDEGPYPWRLMQRSPAVFSDMSPQEAQVKHGNLNAIYMPNFPADFVMPATPVNNFRVLFNAMLGSQFPLLEDRILRKESDIQPNRWDDITEQLLP